MRQWRRHQVLRFRVLQELADQLNVADIQMGKRFVDEDEAAGTVFRFQQADQQHQRLHHLLAARRFAIVHADDALAIELEAHVQARLRQLHVVVFQAHGVGMDFDAGQFAQLLDVLAVGLDGVAQALHVGAAGIARRFDGAVVLVAALVRFRLAAMQLVRQAVVLVDDGRVQFPVVARQAVLQAGHAQIDLVRILVLGHEGCATCGTAPAFRQVAPRMA
ncbi:hypothetical protein D3C72_1669260 [compost metagenome]